MFNKYELDDLSPFVNEENIKASIMLNGKKMENISSKIKNKIKTSTSTACI